MPNLNSLQIRHCGNFGSILQCALDAQSAHSQAQAELALFFHEEFRIAYEGLLT